MEPVSRTILIRGVGARMLWPCLGYEWTQITSLDLPTLGSHELRVWGAVHESASPLPTSSLHTPRTAAAEVAPWTG